jgi:hypothetical protein
MPFRINIYKLLPFAILSLVFQGITSCKKPDPSTDPPASQHLMTIRFTSDFINPKLGAIVFVSDMTGKTLADTMVIGNPLVALSSKAGFHSTFQVTIAKWEPDMHNFLVTIDTYLYVAPGEWTVCGNRPVAAGEAGYELINAPASGGPVLVSGPAYANLTFATAGKLNVYHYPDQLYIKVGTATGGRYKWIPGIAPGASIQCDLTTMNDALQKTIVFSVPAQFFTSKIYGLHDTAAIPQMPVMTDTQFGEGTIASETMLCIPAESFPGYILSAEFIREWGSPVTYLYEKTGQIPDSIPMCNGTVEAKESAGGAVRFSTAGDFTETMAEWRFLDTTNLAFVWKVHGPDTLTSIRLPQIPPSLAAMFPALSHGSLQLMYFELSRFPGLNDYWELLGARFGNESPGRGYRLEKCTVRTELR